MKQTHRSEGGYTNLWVAMEFCQALCGFYLWKLHIYLAGTTELSLSRMEKSEIIIIFF